MRKTLATIILILSIISIVKATSPADVELKNIYNLYNKEDYTTAEQKLQALVTTENTKLQYPYLLELGDFYLDKLNNYAAVESIYKLITEKYPKQKDIADVYYRLGVTYEKEEQFLEAAQMYEMVATKYRKSQYATDALDAIERCFKKNYQDVVAKIDGYPITRIEFDDRISQAPASYDTYDKKMQLLNDMINDRLMYLEAINQGLNQQADYKTRIADIRKNSMFQAWYQREVVNQVKITESDKKKYYSKHKSEFIIPEQASAREILVKTKPEADSLYYLITTMNLPFDSIAQETSLAPTKSAGGDLGYFRRGTHPEELENVVFKLKPKMVSAPFYSPTKNGYMIVKLEDYKPKKVRTYKEAASEIENRIRGERIDKTFKDKTDAFRKACTIVVDDSAIAQNRDTVAVIDGEPLLQQQINDYIARIPPFYRTEFETPEGKMRILDQLILENTWLKQLEKEKYWLLNAVFSQVEESKKNILIGDVRKMEVNDKAIVLDEDIQKYYKKNIAEYKMPKQVRAREITVDNEMTANTVREMALHSKITFDSLAREYSISPTKQMGGDMGFFSAGTKPKDIEQAAFKLNAGQISKVIKQNDSAYTIIKVEEVKDAYTKPLDDVKSAIQRKLRQDKDQELFKEFTSNLYKAHQVETYLVDETPKPEPPKEINPEKIQTQIQSESEKPKTEAPK
jgi:peptidyl-prolyl cis-trans isomerase C